MTRSLPSQAGDQRRCEEPRPERHLQHVAAVSHVRQAMQERGVAVGEHGGRQGAKAAGQQSLLLQLHLESLRVRRPRQITFPKKGRVLAFLLRMSTFNIFFNSDFIIGLPASSSGQCLIVGLDLASSYGRQMSPILSGDPSKARPVEDCC